MADSGYGISRPGTCCDVQHHVVASVSGMAMHVCCASVVASDWEKSGMVILGADWV